MFKRKQNETKGKKISMNKPEKETEDEDESIEVITMILTEALLPQLKPKI